MEVLRIVALLLFAVAIQAASVPVAGGDDAEEDISEKSTVIWNDTVDKILEQAQQTIENGSDPLALPDFVDGFDVQGPLGVEWQAQIGIKQGYLSGLHTIHRVGNATLDSAGMVMNLTMRAELDDLDLHYRFVAEVMNIGANGTIDAIISEADADVVIQIKVIGMKASLLSLDLTLQHIDVTIDGLGPLHIIDGISGTVAEWIVNLVRGPIADAAQQRLFDAINDVLADLDVGSIIG